MTAWKDLGSGARALVLGGGAAVVAVVGALVWQGQKVPAPEVASVAVEETAGAAAPADAVAEPVATESAEPEAQVAAAPEPAVQPAEAPQDAAVEAAPEAEAVAAVEPDAAEPAEPAAAESAAPAPAEPAKPAPEAPAFDVVRIEPDGSALVAGRADPSSAVSIVVDGEEVATASADDQGKFVAMFTLPESDAPRVVTLAMGLADGGTMPSDDSVVLAPTPEPEVLADAGTDATEAAVPAAESESAEAGVPADEPAPAVVAEPAPDAAKDAAEMPAGDVVAAAEPVAVAEPAVEAEAPAALLVTDEGATVLQSGGDTPPEFMRNVTIDTISYSTSGDVQLAGRGQADAFVRLYLDNRPVLDTRIALDGHWSGTLSTVEAGVYALRADQVDADGKVESRYETPFQREAPEALAAAAPSTDQGAVAPVSITVQPGFTLWGIAKENYGDGVMYVRVYEANKAQIRDPDLIYPGQVFAVPSEK